MMILSDVPTVSGTPPAQIGALLTADRQRRAIRCMAQMAVQGASIAVAHPCQGYAMHNAAHFKIGSPQLERQAFIIRQATLVQVRDNTARTTRPYRLVERAHALGWPAERITVIDQDQGHSGASARGRAGFERLIAEVGLGRAGAVFSLEASRLARSCSDGYRLLEICALSATPGIDEDGVYDPGQDNGRLLLGCRGTMSEAESHWLRSRLLGGNQATAERGQLRFRLPIGLVYAAAGRIVLDPDDEIQQAIR